MMTELLTNSSLLYSPVYRPAQRHRTSRGALLPVMAWIHGGGFIFGDAEGGPIGGSFNGTALATAHNVVLVSLQYRLDTLGFLALSEDMGGGPGVTGNLGLLDQRAALQFLQANAAAFGGDPARVLLFGQSAGAVSICAHLTSAASAGLFATAIAESPLCDSSIFFADLAAQLAFGERYAAAVGCPAATSSAVTSSAATSATPQLDCLRALPLDVVVSDLVMNRSQYPPLPGQPSLPLLLPVLPWVLTVDGAEQGVPARPLDRLRAKDYNRVPFIIGTNKVTRPGNSCKVHN